MDAHPEREWDHPSGPPRPKHAGEKESGQKLPRVQQEEDAVEPVLAHHVEKMPGDTARARRAFAVDPVVEEVVEIDDRSAREAPGAHRGRAEERVENPARRERRREMNANLDGTLPPARRALRQPLYLRPDALQLLLDRLVAPVYMVHPVHDGLPPRDEPGED